ncbi:hypothetical protein [Saccharothrix australiensis]|nr:hypothetical protein [Saccharothrix australiensis]
MSDDERRSFPNLLLLCAYHHGLVDGKQTGLKYSVEELERWKKEREGNLAKDLKSLTEDALGELLSKSLTEIMSETKAVLLDAIAKVEDVTGESVELLRILVEETFNRPYLDSDSIASLASSARVLETLPDYIPALQESSYSLRSLPDYAWMLVDSSGGLHNLPDYVPMLLESTEKLSVLPDYAHIVADSAKILVNLPDHATLLESAVESMNRAANRIENLLYAASNLENPDYLQRLDVAANVLTATSSKLKGNVDEMRSAAKLALDATTVRTPDRFVYFRNGAITGAVLMALIFGFIWYMVTHPA